MVANPSSWAAELIDGEIVARAGATRRHNILCGRLHGVKLEDYLQIETLYEYLIVSHERRELELWSRGKTGWSRQLATSGILTLRSGALVDVDRLYASLPD